MRDERLYLISAACFEHQTHMNERDRRSERLDLLFESFVAASVPLHAWVVVPNHYHILIEPGDFAVAGRILRFVHATSARRWNARDERPGRTIWYRYSDRAIRSERHFLTTVNYIHYNPVKHGWSESPYDWQESSVHWYLACHGREWLWDVWCKYPLKAYGEGWDDFAQDEVPSQQSSQGS